MSDESTEENAGRSDFGAALDLCRYVENNQPPIDELVIAFQDVQAVFEITRTFGPSHINIGKFGCDLDDQNICGQIGQVIGRCSTLRRLYIYAQEHNDSLATAQCMAALYDGLKESNSVSHLKVYFHQSDEVPVFDMDYFGRHNQCFESLEVGSTGILSQQQGRLIASAVENTPTLQKLTMSSYVFEDIGSYGDILSKCFRLKSLTVYCDEQYQLDALATMLRDPKSEIQYLYTDGVILNLYDHIEILENILCDTSSIEAIQNSNHTLEIWDDGYGTFAPALSSLLVEECLELNRSQDKEQVARKKIAKYYFTGEFDVSPFVNTNMPLSVVPEVLSKIGGDESDQVSALCRMFKTIPELSYVRKRKENKSKKEQVIRQKFQDTAEELWTLVDEKNVELERNDKLIESKDKLIKEKNAEIKSMKYLMNEKDREIDMLTRMLYDVVALGSEDFSFVSTS